MNRLAVSNRAQWTRAFTSMTLAALAVGMFCGAGCVSPRPRIPRMVHAYDGDLQAANELVCVKVIAPIQVFFVDEAPVKVNGGEMLALQPGQHTLVAGAPSKQRTGSGVADRIASGLSENKELPVTGKAGDLFTLGPDAEDSLSGVTMTINGIPFAIPKTYHAALLPVTNREEAANFFSSTNEPVARPLHKAFLDKPANAQDYSALQGTWKVIGFNMEGQDYTVEEYRQRARQKGGDTTLLDMKLEIRGVRIKWTGSKVRGESILVDMDAERTPKSLRQLSVGTGEDQTFAIYDLQGDTLRYCFGASLPRSFTSAPEMARLSFRLQREAAGKDKDGTGK